MSEIAIYILKETLFKIIILILIIPIILSLLGWIIFRRLIDFLCEILIWFEEKLLH